ncbi:unnamed protein product [Closterium sp. NIES-54]
MLCWSPSLTHSHSPALRCWYVTRMAPRCGGSFFAAPTVPPTLRYAKLHASSLCSPDFLLFHSLLQVLVRDKDGNEMQWFVLHEGDCVGEIAFLCDLTELWTVRTLSVCRVLSISRDDYRSVARTHPADDRHVIANLLNRWHLAAVTGQDKVVQFLLAHGAQVNAKDAFWRTPLQEAVAAGHWSTAEILRRDHFLALNPTYLTVDLLEKHLLAVETSVVAVGAAYGTPRTPFFEGCSPSSLAPSYASAAAVDILGTEDVETASALSGKRRSSKGKGGKSGGDGRGGGGGGGSGGGGGGGV